jgi:hypothetical protein
VKFPIATLEVGDKMLMTTFATLINQKILIPSPRTNYVAVDRNHLVEILKPLLKEIYLDTGWYVNNHPDVAQAISDGVVQTSYDHYISFGFYEHRMPYEIEVDEPWYLAQYPDVGEAVAKGTFASAHEHYYVLGFREGRLPHANFTLRSVS